MKTLIVIVLMMISTSCYALNYEIVKQQTAGYAVKTDDKCSIITGKKVLVGLDQCRLFVSEQKVEKFILNE